MTVYRKLGTAPGRLPPHAHRHQRPGPVAVRPPRRLAWRAVGSAGRWWLADTSNDVRIDNVPPTAPVAYPAAAPRPAGTPAQGARQGAGANAGDHRHHRPVWRSMVGRSWHRGCPVGRCGLRLLRINYWGFDGYRYRGEMVLSTAVGHRAAAALRDMYNRRFPIRRMYRVDRFGWSKRLRGANDYASMRADNTSAFNCRSVVNKPGVRSPHARGRAVDINTWENPYRSRDRAGAQLVVGLAQPPQDRLAVELTPGRADLAVARLPLDLRQRGQPARRRSHEPAWPAASSADAMDVSPRTVVVPLRVVVPLLVALLDLLQRARGFGLGGIRPEPVGVLAPVRALDRVVVEALPELAHVG